MQVVSDPTSDDVIAWLPHGKGFIIYKKKKFASDVLPNHFKQSKYTSFTRKLNRWGFTRVTRGPETGAYYHKFFQRGDVRLCMQMSCQASKGTAQAAASQQAQQGAIKGFPTDVQSQNLIRQQLQQLQMHQFHLQQMQMQQHMQAAEMFRQQQQGGENKDGEENKDSGEATAGEGTAPPPPMDSAAYFQSLQAGMPPGMMPQGLVPGLAPGAAFPPMPQVGPGLAADGTTEEQTKVDDAEAEESEAPETTAI